MTARSWGYVQCIVLGAAVLVLGGVQASQGVEESVRGAFPEPNQRWDLSLPEYDPPTCPEWARVPVPEWVKPFQGKNGMPEPWHSKRGSMCGGAVAGIDRYQANLFVVYRPETANAGGCLTQTPWQNAKTSTSPSSTIPCRTHPRTRWRR